MLTGALPFAAADLRQLVALHVSEPVEPLRQRAPDAGIPVELERVILRALAKKPEERQATVREFARELRSAALEDGRPPWSNRDSAGTPEVSDCAPSISAGRGVTLRFGTPSLGPQRSHSIRIAGKQSESADPSKVESARATSNPESMLFDDSMGGISVGAASASNKGPLVLAPPNDGSTAKSRSKLIALSAAIGSLLIGVAVVAYAFVGGGSAGTAETAARSAASVRPSGASVRQAPPASQTKSIDGSEPLVRPLRSLPAASASAAHRPIPETNPRDAAPTLPRAPRAKEMSERASAPRRKPDETTESKSSDDPAIGNDDLKAPVWR
jgi:hypothetical protein